MWWYYDTSLNIRYILNSHQVEVQVPRFFQITIVVSLSYSHFKMSEINLPILGFVSNFKQHLLTWNHLLPIIFSTQASSSSAITPRRTAQTHLRFGDSPIGRGKHRFPVSLAISDSSKICGAHLALWVPPCSSPEKKTYQNVNVENPTMSSFGLTKLLPNEEKEKTKIPEWIKDKFINPCLKRFSFFGRSIFGRSISPANIRLNFFRVWGWFRWCHT